MGKKKLTAEDIEARLPSYLKLDRGSFQSLTLPAIFIDEQYGKYEAKPTNVIHGSGRHPARAKYDMRKTCLERYGVEHPMQSKVVKDKKTQSNLEKYGVEHVLQADFFKEKAKKTTLERYGVEHATQSEVVREKVRQTNLSRLGVEYPTQSKAVKEKVKKTNLANLGVEYPTQSSLVRDKVKQTCLDKYGVEYASQAEEVKNKRAESNVERYGVTSVLKSEVFKDKVKKTNLERYGVENAMSSPLIQDRLRATNQKRHGVDWYSASPEFNTKTRDTVLNTYGVENVFQSEAIKAKIRATNLERHGVEYPMQSPDIRSKVSTDSKGELELKAFVESFGHATKKWYLGGHPSYELDIYIPTLSLALEYNGDYWHSESARQNDYHYLKSKKAEEKGIFLIHIFESEWYTKQDKIKDFLLLHLGTPERRLHARKLSLKDVSFAECRDFFDAYHLQGRPYGVKACYGLYSNDELIMAAAFSKPHRQNMGDELHLSRLVTKKGCQVVGGISKLCTHAFKRHGAFISYIHNRLSSVKSYVSSGFKVIKNIKPDYWYYDTSKKIVIPKQSRKKNLVETPSGMTEHEHALQEGLVRVYDCGKTKFIFDLN